LLSSLHTWRKIMYPLIGLLILIVFALSMYETYVTNFGPDPSSAIGVPSASGVLPRDDQRGAYVQLKPGADPRFPSSLVQLFDSDTPGIFTADETVQLDSHAIDAVIVSQSTIDPDATQYRVYAVAQDPQETVAERMNSGRMLRIQPKSGLWAPGSYVVDVPSGGMFDNSRVYYTFTVK
jgi:hypothetical protein